MYSFSRQFRENQGRFGDYFVVIIPLHSIIIRIQCLMQNNDFDAKSENVELQGWCPSFDSTGSVYPVYFWNRFSVHLQYSTHLYHRAPQQGSSIVVQNIVLLLQNTAFIRAKMKNNTLLTPCLRLQNSPNDAFPISGFQC